MQAELSGKDAFTERYLAAAVMHRWGHLDEHDADGAMDCGQACHVTAGPPGELQAVVNTLNQVSDQAQAMRLTLQVRLFLTQPVPWLNTLVC